ncbi:MAG: hypothetical protein ACRDH8_03450 [Actinomycetota bacterium]
MAQMSASKELAERPRLQVVEGEAEGASQRGPQVVAVVLSDGTVREVGAEWSEQRPARRDWASGSLAGDGWTLWWERRSFDGA